ncbi:hypothetical protein BU26DRAFT_313111 [Trematosphaeria pertusa]|uniref:Uncharacterized protein n=1 Tax=Trematosphaeria pertusa TaxID=390896 RepID=A0A6A6IEZ6_9PLEO|nr:uncharacterized protein BU26DRAFT_313111 [Trematosphaeria pertusa]KAF2249154.1 hypothetical protein BU26DRAFT_313111 [Trematosphaeria pertusa]
MQHINGFLDGAACSPRNGQASLAFRALHASRPDRLCPPLTALHSSPLTFAPAPFAECLSRASSGLPGRTVLGTPSSNTFTTKLQLVVVLRRTLHVPELKNAPSLRDVLRFSSRGARTPCIVRREFCILCDTLESLFEPHGTICHHRTTHYASFNLSLPRYAEHSPAFP